METVKGPLHGLPISVKEQIGVKGTDSTLGFAKYVFQPSATDAPIVAALKDLGAIPFCKTNVPQSLLTYGCGNPIFGETVNCLNSKLSPGGSSGGEACLIAGGGSVLGIGTDVGGSVRIPAHFCGVVGMKPTRQRMRL
jgi:fatty acid amide hydrolase